MTAGSALRLKANLYNSYELGNLLSKTNAIYFKQETGTLHYNNVRAQSQSKDHPGCLVVHISVQLF